MNQKNKILIDRVIESIDWEFVLKIYKMLNRNVGAEAEKIPGVKKAKKGEKVSVELIKEEVLALVNYVVQNDIPEFMYGPWDISWINGEWEIDISESDPEEEISDENKIYVPLIDSVLEIYFIPVAAVSQERVDFKKISDDVTDEQNDLNKKLELAIKEEDYELASKIRDLIDAHKNK